MADRSYAQYCPIAVALDELGDRWTLLVLRELLISDQRFADLARTLHPIAPNLLTTRLRELEAAGLAIRRDLPPPAARTVYSVTEEGRRVAPVLNALARYGLSRLGPPPAGRVVRPATAVWGLLVPRLDRSASLGLCLAVRLIIDDQTFDLVVESGRIRRELPPGGPDLTITTTARAIAELGHHGRTFDKAVADGSITVTGGAEPLAVFRLLFRIGSGAGSG